MADTQRLAPLDWKQAAIAKHVDYENKQRLEQLSYIRAQLTSVGVPVETQDIEIDDDAGIAYISVAGERFSINSRVPMFGFGNGYPQLMRRCQSCDAWVASASIHNAIDLGNRLTTFHPESCAACAPVEEEDEPEEDTTLLALVPEIRAVRDSLNALLEKLEALTQEG